MRMFATTKQGRFETRQAAHRWAARKYPDKRQRMIVRCDFDPQDCPSKQPIDIYDRRDDR